MCGQEWGWDSGGGGGGGGGGGPSPVPGRGCGQENCPQCQVGCVVRSGGEPSPVPGRVCGQEWGGGGGGGGGGIRGRTAPVSHALLFPSGNATCQDQEL